MSIDPVGNRSVTPDARNDESENAKGETRAQEFDFAGGAHAAVHIPRGMIAAATGRPTVATLATDFAAFKSKLVQIHVDLASPALRNMYAKTAAATWTMQKIQARVEAAVLVVAVLKDKGVAALFSVPSAMTSLMSAVDDIKALPQQIRDALGAAHAAHPDVVRVEHDAVDLARAAAKLAIDLKSVGVW